MNRGTPQGRCPASGSRTAGERGNQVHLVSIVQTLPRVRLTPVDHKEYGVLGKGEGKSPEQVRERASGWKRHVKTPQRPGRRGPLQRRVEMHGDRDFYQLKTLSRSASEAS